MLVLLYVVVFLLGALAGVAINYCADRLPFEKSLFWPGPRCSSCLARVRWYDQIPILSYLLLLGRCRTCRARLPLRYFLVELGTGLAFLGLFWMEIVRNSLALKLIRDEQPAILAGDVPLHLWAMFGHHALLVTLLILVSVCDLEHLEIPLGITVFGTLLGLIGSVLLPWPFPDRVPVVASRPQILVPGPLRIGGVPDIPHGAYPWPVWYQQQANGSWSTPAWLPAGSWQLGLATGLAGAVMGALVLRGVRFLFGVGRGIEGLGLGDADLMMMAGSFLGWQPILFAFFMGVFPALFFGVVQLLRKGDQPMPFGPSLAIGVLIVLFSWPWLGDRFRILLFDGWIMGGLFLAGAVFLLITSFLLRLIRGRPQAEDGKGTA